MADRHRFSSPSPGARLAPPAGLRSRLHIALLLVLACGLGNVQAAVASNDTMFPAIAPVITSTGSPGNVVVHGTGFTPGGLVFIVIHDRWGMAQHETRWVIASPVSYQPPPGLEPAEGFSFDTGGNIAESFSIPLHVPASLADAQNPAVGSVASQATTMAGVECAVALMVTAYDRSTATWSDIGAVDLAC